MTRRPAWNPQRRRAYRAFRTATQFGVLYSHASSAVWPDLVDAGTVGEPLTASQALDRKRHTLAAQPGVEAILVARVEDDDGNRQWRDVYGRTPMEVIRDFEEKPVGARFGGPPSVMTAPDGPEQRP